MSKKTFYDFKGEPIGVKEFIELYEPCYFIQSDNKKDEEIRCIRTSRYVEVEEIEPILEEGIKSRADLAKVMAWKIGKIKHKESKEKIVYASDWELCEKENPMRYGKEMDLNTLADYILGNRDKLEVLAADKPQECLNWLRDITRENKIVGLGSVYLINLLFFLSRGKCPIYDRFAMASLRAYEDGLSPVGHKGKPPVKVPNLPDKNSKRFETICENGAYAEYIEKLDALGVDYKEDRRLDRALWVYGHAFEVKEGKCC